jgi:cysteine desulfurase
MKQPIYLDHNATTDLLNEVKESMITSLGISYNPSSVHSFGQRAKAAIENARSQILTALHASREKYRLIFTSSGTEANNLVMHNFIDSHLFVSAVEHASILKPAMSRQSVSIIKVDSNGLLDLSDLEHELAKSKATNKLVSVMYANNETGAIQNIAQITRLAHRYNAIIHTDAVQAFGKIHINLADLGVDLITISSHKCGGPVGAAALIYKKAITLHAQILGGGQERGIRSGTENVVAIVGLGKIAELLLQIINKFEGIRKLRDLLEGSISSMVPEVIIFSKNVTRLPNTSCLTMPYISNDVQLINFDLTGFAVSAGAACSSGKIETSNVLLAMGVDKNVANTAIRVSLGISNTLEDINSFIAAWKSIYSRLSVNFNNHNQLAQHNFGQVENNSYIH